MQIAHRAGSHRPAFIEDAETVSDLTGKTQLLFHQQHGHALFPVQVADHLTDLVDDIGPNALGVFIENQ